MVCITDKTQVRNGSDYTFVCSRIPFAVSCSSNLPHGEYNLIDMDLVLRMKIPLQRIKVERYSVLGQSMRAVGYVSQTVQCVRQGKVSGNIHFQAKVVRDLFAMFDVDCIASSKTYTRLVGKDPVKSPDDEFHDNMELADDEDDNIELADDEDDNNACDEDREDITKVQDSKAVGKDSIASKKEAATKDEDEDADVDNGRCGEVNIGDIPWNWRYHHVPTVDELYPDDTPEDNARWLQELHQPRPNTPPPKTIGNKKSNYKSNMSTEEADDGEIFCKLCFTTGQPLSTVNSHHTLHISCPTMTDDEKETIYGPNWVARMYGYPD